MTGNKTPAPVIFTDDAWIFNRELPPRSREPGPHREEEPDIRQPQADLPTVTVQDLREKVVGSYANTGAPLWWSTGDHEVYHYETRVGEIIGHAGESPDDGTYGYRPQTSAVVKEIGRNVRALIDECGGPMTAMVDLCHEADMEFFPRVRMNSHYETPPLHPLYGRFRRENPELLIGWPGEELSEGGVPYGIRTGLNYAFPQIREYMAAIICELFERFDVDGVEMDFFRHPAFFRIEEAYQSRYLMTSLVGHVRERMNEVGEERGRELKLAVRVPVTIADSTRIGLDVARWMADGLVDTVVVGGGHIPFETPVREFVEAARGTDCLVYGCITASRYLDPRNIRALASRFLSHGAAGTYLYNFYTMSREWNERTFSEISDPVTLSRLDKRYELDRTGPFYPCRDHGCAFRYASPSAQLPITLKEDYSGLGPVLRLEINDDLEAAGAAGSLGACGLSLKLDNFTQDDELQVRVNQQTFPWDAARVSFDGWTELHVESWHKWPTEPVEYHRDGISVEYDLGSPPLKEGVNELEVQLISRVPKQRDPVVLHRVETTITYDHD